MLRISHLKATLSLNRSYHVGFIGLGQMGYPMASNLALKIKPSTLKVMDVNVSSADRLVKELGEKGVQAHVASDFSEFESADVIITMLPAAAHVKQVINSLLPNLKRGAYIIDSSTIDPETCKWVKEITSQKQVTVFDAPVSGGTPGAVAGTLTFMVGSPSKSDFDKVTPILQGMGKNIVYCGGNGNGQVAKICNNMMLGISMIAASETFSLGASLGMDPKLLASIINTSTGRCWSTDSYNPVPGVLPNVPSSRGYTGGFGNKLIAKDLGLAVEAAKSCSSPVFMGGMAHQIYTKLSTDSQYENKDFSSVYEWIKNPKS